MTIKGRLFTYSWFLLINIIIVTLIGLRYFYFLPDTPFEFLEVSFIALSLFSQMALLSFIIYFCTLPIIIFPNYLFRVLVALVATISITVLVVDTFVFSQYRFHLNQVVLKLVLSGDVVDFTFSSYVMLFAFLAAVFFFQHYLLLVLEHRPWFVRKKIGRKFLALAICSFFLSNFLHIWAAANVYQPIMLVKSYLPLFQPATANRFMAKHGLIDEEALARQKTLSTKNKSNLNYPLKQLEVNNQIKPINILFLVVDSWRYDAFNPENTPNLWDYAQKGKVYGNHISTGNATRTGIFGLFYGLPGTYWQSVFLNRRSPVFMDRLQELNYQIGTFTSASLTNPEFNQTIFSKVPNIRLRSQGDSPAQRDANLTEDWVKWYRARDLSQPSFSFLFYDAPHGYDFPEGYSKKYEPMLETLNYLTLNNDTNPVPFMNRYKTSVRYVDDLAKKVFDEIKLAGDENNTLIVITGDHAQEINDNKLNYWGHNSNFTAAQVHVPFALVGPKITPNLLGEKTKFTSHEDVVPTIMKNYLGVSTGIEQYSTGVDLLSTVKEDRDWVMSSSYSAYSMITKESILEVKPSGQYQLMDLTNRSIDGKEPNFSYLKDVLERISRFNQ
ncbi:DUF3413 domain-containing protein [Marinomonas transparens]|uniref:DUF3413 domain-containing protein n=1 Tax=Marinomonas transparens TaxID=2795388 RepID=A0A934JU55_9GAMM|nr:DUF3413 domain-containing protein [Marinomonas transparens]MBJ7538352.1 DUF3413 domain-containing protein [Marinomonas transparens]